MGKVKEEAARCLQLSVLRTLCSGKMSASILQGSTEELYGVKGCLTRRHPNQCFAMIYVYITSSTRRNLHRAVVGDDGQTYTFLSTFDL